MSRTEAVAINPDGWYSTREAAVLLPGRADRHLSERTLLRWRKAGLVAARKFGQDWRFSGREIIKLLREGVRL